MKLLNLKIICDVIMKVLLGGFSTVLFTMF